MAATPSFLESACFIREKLCESTTSGEEESKDMDRKTFYKAVYLAISLALVVGMFATVPILQQVH